MHSNVRICPLVCVLSEMKEQAHVRVPIEIEFVPDAVHHQRHQVQQVGGAFANGQVEHLEERGSW